METKFPVPVPSEVLESAVVGLVFVLQQIPLLVTFDAPSDEIIPPLIAVVVSIEVIAAVVSVGKVALELSESSLEEHDNVKKDKINTVK